MRKAIVIGVSDYDDKSMALKNPVNDANLMKTILEKVGFDIKVYLNPTQKELLDAIVEYQYAMREYNEILFYYAGHGFEYDGENFITPTDFINKDDKILITAVNISKIIERGSFDNITQMFILDACRTHLHVRKRGINISDTLGIIAAPSGTLISYATAPKASASDGDGDNGLFTSILCEHILEPNVKIEDMLKKVRKEVMRQSDNKQTPWEHSSLIGNFYFNYEMYKVETEGLDGLMQSLYKVDDKFEYRQYGDSDSVKSEISFKIENSKYDEFYIISKTKTVYWMRNVVQWWAPNCNGYCEKKSEAGIYSAQDLYDIIYPYDRIIPYTKSIAIPKDFADKMLLDDIVPLNDSLFDLLKTYRKVIIGDLNFNLPLLMR